MKKIAAVSKILGTFGLVLCVLLAQPACKKDEGGTGPGGGGSGEFITIQTPIGSFTIPTMGLTNLKGLLITTPEEGQPTAVAFFFGSSTSQLVYAGDVTVNSNTVDTLTAGGQVIYIRPGPTNPNPLTGVNFDGSMHSWTVSGGSGIPAFSGSVASPNGIPTITFPSDSATVSRGLPLTVTWTGSGSDSVLISLSDTQAHELVAITGGNSYTFSATQMGTLVAGEGYLNVNRLKFTLVAAGGGSYVIGSATNANITITLN